MVGITAPLDWTGGPAMAWVICAATLYWLGGRHGAVVAQGSADRWRLASFALGLVAIVAALGSPIDRLADSLFWAHMVQHVLLIAVAPPLLALARPWNRMWRGLPLEFRRPVARALAQDPRLGALRRVARFVAEPLPSWMIFNLTFLAWHLPGLYDAALRHSAIHALEHALFFSTALLFWTRVVYSPPWRSPLSEAGKLIYLGTTMIAGWVLAVVLALAQSPIYSAYADRATRPGGISPLADQQLAAGVMWVPGSLPFAIALVVIAYRWLEPRAPAKRRPGIGSVPQSP